jgi:hypothetical protein
MAVAGIGLNFAGANLNQDLGSGTPATWYVALLTAMPTDGAATGLVEATWTGYARPSLTNNGTNFPAYTNVANVATVVCGGSVDWGTVSGLSGPITVVGLAFINGLTATPGVSTMGRTAVFGTIASPVTYTLNNGSDLSIAAGNLSFQEQ